MTSRLILLLTAFVVVIALVPTSVSAFSFSSFLKDDESSASNATEVEEASSEEGSQAEADLSDGTDIRPRQPILDAEGWFLTEQEITASRGGVPRDDMAVYTTGNKVTSYTVANEFYDAVYEDLSATKEGDRVMLAAWLTALVPLKPDVDFIAITDAVRKVSDPQDTCTYSGSTSSEY